MIREAERKDAVAILGLIKELAAYEKEPDAVIVTPAQLENDLFNEQICHALVVEVAGEIIGFALYYFAYSTWKGKCLYLEDFYLKPESRRAGWGLKLFQKVKNVAIQEQVKRMDWQVLEWNTPAIEFYKKVGATLDPTWINGRLFF